MALYLVQHGLANPKDEDPERNLSKEGRSEVGLIAEAARKHRIGVRRIEHGGKLRARQTAEIFEDALAPPNGLGERGDIGPVDDVKPVAGDLDAGAGLMLVGHLPFMEKIAAYLVTGREEPKVLEFQNGGIVCLDRDPDSGTWHLKYTLFPNMD